MNQQIVVREIVPPRPGGKQYSVIDTAGQRWGVYADHIGEYNVGGIYNIVKSRVSTFNGKQYTTLEEAEFVGVDQGGQAQRPQLPPPPAPRPQTYAPRSGYQKDDPNKSLHIFVCGAFNNMMANQNMVPQDLTVPQLIQIISNLTTAYRQTLGKEANPNADMGNEEIPF